MAEGQLMTEQQTARLISRICFGLAIALMAGVILANKMGWV